MINLEIDRQMIRKNPLTAGGHYLGGKRANWDRVCSEIVRSRIEWPSGFFLDGVLVTESILKPNTLFTELSLQVHRKREGFTHKRSRDKEGCG